MKKFKILALLMVLSTWVLGQTNKIESTGNVGIGTTNPDGSLNIVGNVPGTQVKLHLANTANSGFSVIRFSDVASGNGRAYIHRFNSNWVSNTAMWQANSIGFYESVGSMNIGGKQSFKVFTGGNNSERLRVTEGGDVGIGTTDPGFNLEVAGTFGTAGNRFTVANGVINQNSTIENWASASNQGGLSFNYDGRSAPGGTSQALFRDFSIYNGKGQMLGFFDGSSGNVGIGTSAPTARMHVSSTTSGDAVLRIEADTDNNNEGDNARIEMIQDGGGIAAYIGFNRDWQGTSIDPDNLFRIGSRHTGVDNFDRLVINTHNGNVGLGTASPESRLHVSSTTAGDAVLRIEADTDNNNEGDNARIEMFQDGGGLGAYIGFNRDWSGTSTEPDNLFRIGSRYAGVDSFDRLVINTNNGNVGIGTASPTQKLSVNGTIRAQEIILEASPWPDYVFEADYELRSLEEVEQFVKTNGHLPNIPSAKEVQGHGFKAGEMNTKLLEKIEELTLYSIQQEKEIKNLKDQNNSLKALEKEVQELKKMISKLMDQQ